MNRKPTNQNLTLLVIATIGLTGNIAMADQPRADKPIYQVLQSGNIVMAEVILTPETTVEAVVKQPEDAAVTEALQAVLADNRLELDSRLSDRKSLLVVTDR